MKGSWSTKFSNQDFTYGESSFLYQGTRTEVLSNESAKHQRIEYPIIMKKGLERG